MDESPKERMRRKLQESRTTECRTCGKEVATDARTCPECGTQWPGNGSMVLIQAVIALGALGLIVYALVTFLSLL